MPDNPCTDDPQCKAATKAFLLAQSAAGRASRTSLGFCKEAKAAATTAAAAAAIAVTAAATAKGVCAATFFWAPYVCAGSLLIAAAAAATASVASGFAAGKLYRYTQSKPVCQQAMLDLDNKYDAMVQTCGKECAAKQSLSCTC